MNENMANDDDGLYTLIEGDGDGDGDGEEAGRSEDGPRRAANIVNSLRSVQSKDIIGVVAAREVSDPSSICDDRRSKMVKERLELNMGLYLPPSCDFLRRKRKDVWIGGDDEFTEEVLCRGCGGVNTSSGIDWCLLCGVLLIESGVDLKSMQMSLQEINRNSECDNNKVKSDNNSSETLSGNVDFIEENNSMENVSKNVDFIEENNSRENSFLYRCAIKSGGVKWRNVTVEEIKDNNTDKKCTTVKGCNCDIVTCKNDRECKGNRIIRKPQNEFCNDKSKNTKNVINDSIKLRSASPEDIFLSTVKLDLKGVETSRSNGGIEWDFDIHDNINDNLIHNDGMKNINCVPRLDLSDLHSRRDVSDIVIAIEESKENKGKVTKKWSSSSTAWADMPESLLKKKPSSYYRNKLNSCTNKIGVTVLQSGLVHNDRDIKHPASPNDFIIKEASNILDIERKSQPSLISIDLHRNRNDVSNRNENVNVDNNRIIYRLPDIIQIKYENNSVICLWQCLPAEIWLKIMMYLSHHHLSVLQQTCRRIYFIGLDSPLWKSINLYRHSTLNNDHIFYIARKKPSELHFKNCFGTNITVEGLKAMFKICGEGLKKISFISCSKGAFEDDRFLVLSASYCPNVTHINASYLMNLHDETLKYMIEGFTKIESLNIMGAHSISNKSIKSLIEHHRASLINLDLYGCFKLNSITLTLLEGCLNLRSLALGSISNLKRSALIGMLKKLSQLIILDLRGTMNLVDDSLLQQICQSCPNLQQIILTNSCRLTDDGLIGLAKSCVSKSLNILDICGCSKITEKSLEEVLKYCHELEDLDISCTGIRGDGARYFKIYSPPKLRCLRINNNKFISKEELFSLVSACKKLVTLYMCGTTSIGSWRPIEEKFPHITFKHE